MVDLHLQNESLIMGLGLSNIYISDLLQNCMRLRHATDTTVLTLATSGNGTAHFKKCKQLFEYQHLLLLRDIWWSKL
jgi:hypothetical protein